MGQAPPPQNAKISRIMLQMPRDSFAHSAFPFPSALPIYTYLRCRFHQRDLHEVRNVANSFWPQCILAGDSAVMRTDFDVILSGWQAHHVGVIVGCHPGVGCRDWRDAAATFQRTSAVKIANLRALPQLDVLNPKTRPFGACPDICY